MDNDDLPSVQLSEENDSDVTGGEFNEKFDAFDDLADNLSDCLQLEEPDSEEDDDNKTENVNQIVEELSNPLNLAFVLKSFTILLVNQKHNNRMTDQAINSLSTALIDFFQL